MYFFSGASDALRDGGADVEADRAMAVMAAVRAGIQVAAMRDEADGGGLACVASWWGRRLVGESSSKPVACDDETRGAPTELYRADSTRARSNVAPSSATVCREGDVIREDGWERGPTSSTLGARCREPASEAGASVCRPGTEGEGVAGIFLQ